MLNVAALYRENPSLYTLHEWQHAALAPLNFSANATRNIINSPFNPFGYTLPGRTMAAASELVERVTTRFSKPAFGLTETEVDGVTYPVRDIPVSSDIYCDLLHFEKQGAPKQPKLLMVAPMSGHFATLLRNTVRDMLPFYDIYITDWKDARDVPLYEGTFGLSDYIDYCVKYMQQLGPDLHVMAVCQPAVPVFAAVAAMAAANDPKQPSSIILIGGPIDTREAPTGVNELAQERSLDWFERNVITRVPMNYPGFMRRVYPGFLQLGGFMTMNLEVHVGAHVELFQHLVDGDGDSAEKHRHFYDEYLAVMDIPANFYLETVEEVFQKHSLPKGEMPYHDGVIDPSAIRHTSILCLEGERDDISGLGQTKAALNITPNLPDARKHYHMQKGVGHYGVFNGSKFRKFVRPVITSFTDKAAKHGAR